MSESIAEVVEAEAADTAAVVADVIAESVAEDVARDTAIEVVAPVVDAIEDLAEDIAETVNDFKEETEWEKTRALMVETASAQTAAIIAGVAAALNPQDSLSPSGETMEELTEAIAEETAAETAGEVEQLVVNPEAAAPSEAEETSKPTRRRLVGKRQR